MNNKKNNIYFIIGTRAQLIKLIPVMSLMRDEKKDYTLIYTGQHAKTMYSMLKRFNLKGPDIILYKKNKDIVSPATLIYWFFYCIFKSIKLPLRSGVALLHGDTPSTLLGVIICKIKKIKIIHIEAGLRSHNIFHPFPEELIRMAVTKLSDCFMAQNRDSYDNLKKINKPKVNLGANTLLDTLRMTSGDKTKNAYLPNHPFVVVTMHRFENIFFKKILVSNLKIILGIAKKHKILFVLHPPTEARLKKWDLFKMLRNENIKFIPRLQYFEFISLVKKCEFLVTDGGSCQEESSYLGVPCLLLRKTTERTEGLGKNAVISNFDKKIIDAFVDNYKKYRIKEELAGGSPSAEALKFLYHNINSDV